MSKFILIGGHIHKAQDGGKAFCDELMKDVSERKLKILDCLFARPQEEWSAKFEDDKNFFQKQIQNFEIELATQEKFIEQTKASDVVFFQGGIPRELISVLENIGGWREALKEKVLAGSSGGADAFCKYYGVGKTGNIGEGLGFLPIKFIPHWKSDYAPGVTIDWDGLREKLESYKEDLPVYTVKEGEFVVINE